MPVDRNWGLPAQSVSPELLRQIPPRRVALIPGSFLICGGVDRWGEDLLCLDLDDVGELVDLSFTCLREGG